MTESAMVHEQIAASLADFAAYAAGKRLLVDSGEGTKAYSLDRLSIVPSVVRPPLAGPVVLIGPEAPVPAADDIRSAFSGRASGFLTAGRREIDLSRVVSASAPAPGTIDLRTPEEEIRITALDDEEEDLS